MRPEPHVNLMSQKMGIHEWSYDNAVSERRALQGAVGGGREGAGEHQGRGRTRLRPRDRLQGGRGECLNCDVQTVFTAPLCIECDACTDICPMDCISFVANGERRTCARACRPRRATWRRTSTSPAPLKTQRVMVKDEDVCLHCGLCAERCPTGAWDMQKFLFLSTYAGRKCRDGKSPAKAEGLAA